MLVRLIIFKVVLAVLVFGSAFGLAIRDSVKDTLRGGSGNTGSAGHIFPQYPLPLGMGCVAVALAVAFGDLLLAGRSKGALPTYTDEEFLANFGGNAEAQQPLH